MAAIQRTRMSSFGAGAFVVAVSAALLAGASGGYLVRALTAREFTPAQTAQHLQFAATNEDVTQSDLTRVQPADQSTGVTQVPSWVKAYMAPAAQRALRVDEYIESMSYAGTANASSADQTAAPALQFQP